MREFKEMITELKKVEEYKKVMREAKFKLTRIIKESIK